MSTEAKSLTGILEDLWDGGNATGLDGWIGPGRGAGEVDDQAIWDRDRDVKKALSEVTLAKSRVLVEVADERGRQNVKWGEQNHPSGTGPDVVWSYTGPAAYVADVAKSECQRLSAEGMVTFADILLEEVAEAFAELDPAKLRAELIQVAAVATQWVESIDRTTK